MLDTVQPLDQLSIAAEEFFRLAPPVIIDRNKSIVFEIACPPDARHDGIIEYTRWPKMALPEDFDGFDPGVYTESRSGFYDYERLLPHSVEWHVNFADPHLFVSYGGPLMAQDEIMAAEHPVLGALVEYLGLKKMEARTLKRPGEPTPVLVVGAERRCHLDTRPNDAEGRPEGLYGNLFAHAPAEAVRRAVKPITHPEKSNIIAISAPMGGHGPYTRHDIEVILTTAYSGYKAAELETTRLWDEGVPAVIHTGYWGCGAFGGNRELMAILQVFAAHLAGVDHVVFHGGNVAGVEIFRRAMKKLPDFFPERPSEGLTNRFIDAVTAHGFRWGVSDGN
ncbi:MAG: hypothetical protein JJU11_01785 [Candidatus Sumerlaeia bacterium]|nr:hypothetical protein [Candidatus Sumerlaeia bacterium]